MLSLAFVIIIWHNGSIDGWNQQARKDTQEWEIGGGQLWHSGYDPLDPLSIPDAHAPLSEQLLKPAEEGKLAPVLAVQASAFPQGRMQGVLLKGIEPEQKILKIPTETLQNQPDGALIGKRMAETLKLKVGDALLVRWRDSQGTFDALELNIYYMPTKLHISGADVEQMYIDLVRDVTQSVRIPVAVKLSPYFSAMANMARRLTGAGADGLVLFNRLDFAFIIQALGRDINFNRLERYLTICYDADIQPIVIVTKTDLWPSAEVDEIIIQMKKRVPNIAIIPVSNVTQSGVSEIKKTIIPGKTYAFLGSSGVGKSSLINNLLGIPLMATQEVSTSTSKGKHRTTHRELHVLSDGGILIDNPGMREVGLTDTNQGLELTFEEIKLLAVDCRYKDCTHVHEQGCAVIRAVEEGRLEAGIYSNYIKMYKETAFFESSALEKRRREKEAGKMMKNYKKDIQRNNFLKP